MSLCEHLKQIPSYKIEGGICMNCNNYKCYNCLDYNYYQHIFGKYGKRRLFIIQNDFTYKYNEFEQINKYKERDMIAICYNCINKMNNPSILNKITFMICGK